MQCLCEGKTIDVYLEELLKLLQTFVGILERALTCTFVTGLSTLNSSFMHGDNVSRPNSSIGQGDHESQYFSRWTGCTLFNQVRCASPWMTYLHVQNSKVISLISASISTECIWIESWKWTNGQSPDDLKNKILKYFVLKNIREDYDKELQLVLDNGWLILSPEK